MFGHQAQSVETLDAALELLPASEEENFAMKELAKNWGIEH